MMGSIPEIGESQYLTNLLGVEMKFKLEIRTDNAVYEDALYDELISNLKVVINQIDSQEKDGIIRDTNGNKVGRFYLTQED
jgi:hypothetical protein